MSAPHDLGATPLSADVHLKSLLTAWEVFDERLSPMHRAYHEEVKLLTSAGPRGMERASLAQTSAIEYTAQYATIPTSPLDTTSEAHSLHSSSHVTSGASASHSAQAQERQQDREQKRQQERQEQRLDTPQVNRSYPAELAPQRPVSNLWNRDGFTPAPRVPVRSASTPIETLVPQDSTRAKEPSSVTPSAPQQSAQTARHDQAHNSSSSAAFAWEPIGEHEASGIESPLDASAPAEELEAFASIAERLMQAQERMESERASDDSSRPTSLDELYEPSPIPGKLNSIVSRPTDALHDEELLGGVAPRPLIAPRRRSWGKVILVIFIAVGVGAGIAYASMRGWFNHVW